MVAAHCYSRKRSQRPYVMGEKEAAMADSLRIADTKLAPLPLFAEEPLNNEAMDAINAIIAESTPRELAENLKDSGNEAFKLGKARYADAIEYYKQALQKKCDDDKLNSTIRTNRALVNLKLENYGRTVDDCKRAIKLNPLNKKAYHHKAKAHLALGHFKECKATCQLAIEKFRDHAEFKKIRATCLTELRKTLAKEQERFEGLSEIEKAKKRRAEDLSIGLHKRKLKISEPEFNFHNMFEYELTYDMRKNTLHFPVLFIYEEFSQTDIIQDFQEQQSLLDHLDNMFPPSVSSPNWDKKGLYRADTIECYYKARNTNALTLASNTEALIHVVKKEDFEIRGLPVFYLISKESPFRETFLERKTID